MPDLSTYPLTPEGVTEALNALPVGSEDIAIRLAEFGIKGQRDNDCACPVAHYLERAIPDAESVTVGGTEAFVCGLVRDDLGFTADVRIHVGFPDGVCAFVEDFDGRKYPDLIEEVKA